MYVTRRSRKFVDFEVQVSLLRRITIHWLVFIIANAMALFFWSRLIQDPLGTWSEQVAIFASQFAPVLFVSLALLPVFLLDAARLSNRFTGPILRIRRALIEISAGKKPEAIHFRQGDFWKSLAADYNLAMGVTNDPTQSAGAAETH